MARYIEVDFTRTSNTRPVTPEQAFLCIRDRYVDLLVLHKREEQYIRQVAQMLYSSYDPGEQVLTVELPPGFSEPPRLKEELMDVVGGLDFYRRIGGFNLIRSKQVDGHVIIERPHKMEGRSVDWLWENYIPLGRITILAGDPGIGKSQTAIDLIARITNGGSMPDGSQALRGNCAIATAEDETSETIIPRLYAAGANMTSVIVIRKVRLGDEERYLALPRDLNRLRVMIREERLRLVVIDPLNAFVEQSVNTYKDQDIRSVLAPVEGIAEEMQCSILIIAHLNKREEASTLYRVGGSIGFIGAARSVLAVQRKSASDGSGDLMNVLYSIKENLGKKPPARQFIITGEEVEEPKTGEMIRTSKVEWHGQCANPTRGRDDGPRMRKECMDFLIAVFGREDEVLSEEIKTDARNAGVSWRTLQEYKPQFKVQSFKRHGQWYWKAPEGGFRQFKNAK